VIIPGVQAPFGFQLSVTLTYAFQQLPAQPKIVHAVALCSIGVAIVLVMAPTSLHRISLAGEDDPLFPQNRFRTGMLEHALVHEPRRRAAKMQAWRRDYNEERPHSAIGNKAPIELVNRSTRPALIESWRRSPARWSKDWERFKG
jgi:Integrase core domain/Family of unknown function (DUF6328)